MTEKSSDVKEKSSVSLLGKMFPWGPPPVIRHVWLDDPLRLAILKENAAYRAFWEKHGGNEAVSAYAQIYLSDNPDLQAQKVPSKIRELADVFNDGLHTFGILIKSKHTGSDLLQILDPFNEELPEYLPLTFWREVPVAQVVNFEMSGLIEFDYFIDKSQVDILEPSERLLVIDVSCRKDKILREVKRFIDSVKETRDIAHLMPDEKYKENYSMWQPDVSRRREETWNHLQVWRLRRQRKSYLQIYRETGIKVNAAKKAFARAYELIEGRRYTPDHFKDIYKEIQAPELIRTCVTCPDHPSNGGSCNELCPDVLAFVDQDYGSLFGRLTSTGVPDAPPKRKNLTKLSDE